MAGADILVHLPALHGIHVVDHTETEFWELNVNGTFRTLQAAVAAGVGKVVWLSSQAWHDSNDVYGFTKVIGEQLLDYHRTRHGISYVAVFPASLVQTTAVWCWMPFIRTQCRPMNCATGNMIQSAQQTVVSLGHGP
ncbi:NAD-dependent epimerase/dehydratase family protein [Arthrobacter sp. 2MCAF14]|uniref:NAD-dependent epimerase/dehydratase family protein n=1 Tax=Arthrobacter sp. 2MCAF14 TaxID=3232982 RepID=UPI003F902CFA